MSSKHTNIHKIEVINIIKYVIDTDFVNKTIMNETPNLCKDAQKQNYFGFNRKHCIQLSVSNGKIYIIHFLTFFLFIQNIKVLNVRIIGFFICLCSYFCLLRSNSRY
jgi:hypothetical protein